MGPTHRSPSKRPKRLQRTDGVTQTSMFFLVGSKPFCVRCEWDGRQGTKPQALGAQQSQTDARGVPNQLHVGRWYLHPPPPPLQKCVK